MKKNGIIKIIFYLNIKYYLVFLKGEMDRSYWDTK